MARMILYDNIDDIKTKLVGTYCYYQGKAVIVKDAMMDIDPATSQYIYLLAVAGVQQRARWVRLDDPDFNYMHFNLGYSNHGHSAVWWYRNPVKQWRQGLRVEQIGQRASNNHYIHNVNFGFSKPIADMMENEYPPFMAVEPMLRSKEAEIVAFHRDFACTWDEIHRDLIVEYKGKKIGCMLPGDTFRLVPEANYLTEALKEAVA